jgi:hypothetical protein
MTGTSGLLVAHTGADARGSAFDVHPGAGTTMRFSFGSETASRSGPVRCGGFRQVGPTRQNDGSMSARPDILVFSEALNDRWVQ